MTLLERSIVKQVIILDNFGLGFSVDVAFLARSLSGDFLFWWNPCLWCLYQTFHLQIMLYFVYVRRTSFCIAYALASSAEFSNDVLIGMLNFHQCAQQKWLLSCFCAVIGNGSVSVIDALSSNIRPIFMKWQWVFWHIDASFSPLWAKLTMSTGYANIQLLLIKQHWIC